MAMSKHYTLTATKRERAGKGVARALRREDLIPAVIYGDHKEPVMISMPVKEVSIRYFQGGIKTHICELTVDGKKETVLARDVQLNPVTDRVEHVDFMRVGPKTKLVVDVPVHFVGQEASPGIKAKGILNIVHHNLELRCAAGDIPEALEIDISAADLGAALKLSAIRLPKGAEIMGHKGEDITVATIVAPTVKAADAAADAAAATPAAPAAGAKAAPAAAKPAAKK
ncbi:MAG TPA: 50S ribosomal protein L25 [Rhodospirillaceae bacterium]|nr:50S ribosomal protein L25 [Rhodospirillaceae bacterium]